MKTAAIWRPIRGSSIFHSFENLKSTPSSWTSTGSYTPHVSHQLSTTSYELGKNIVAIRCVDPRGTGFATNANISEEHFEERFQTTSLQRIYDTRRVRTLIKSPQSDYVIRWSGIEVVYRILSTVKL